MGRCGAAIIGVVKKAAEIRLNAQCIRVVRARPPLPNQRRTFASIQCDLGDSEARQAIKAVITVSQTDRAESDPSFS